jgi:hypothetical protein
MSRFTRRHVAITLKTLITLITLIAIACRVQELRARLERVEAERQASEEASEKKLRSLRQVRLVLGLFAPSLPSGTFAIVLSTPCVAAFCQEHDQLKLAYEKRLAALQKHVDEGKRGKAGQAKAAGREANPRVAELEKQVRWRAEI